MVASRKKVSLCFFLCSGVCQILFILSCTIWRKVIFVPSAWCRPPLSKDYWFWLVDERIPPIPYEDKLLSLYFQAKPVLIVCLLAGILWLLFLGRKNSKRNKFYSVLVLSGSATLFLITLGYSRAFGQPYYLFIDVFPAEILSTDFLLLSHTIRYTSSQ